MSEIYVSDFYSWTKFDPDARITKSEYLSHFDKFKNVKFIQFIKELTDGYKDEYLNFEDNT